MQDEEPEMGRFDRKGDPNEPIEPFYPDEMLEPEDEVPSIKSLHVPHKPVKKQALKFFLIELKPIVEKIQDLSREDQHHVGKILHELKQSLQGSSLPEDILFLFDKLLFHYNQLLTHSEPKDQNETLEKIQEIQTKL